MNKYELNNQFESQSIWIFKNRHIKIYSLVSQIT